MKRTTSIISIAKFLIAGAIQVPAFLLSYVLVAILILPFAIGLGIHWCSSQWYQLADTLPDEVIVGGVVILIIAPLIGLFLLIGPWTPGLVVCVLGGWHLGGCVAGRR